MSQWLLDASVFLAAEDSADEHHQGAVRVLTGGDTLTTLDLALYETYNVAVAAWQDPRAARRLAASLDAVADDGGVVRVDHSLIITAGRIAFEEEISVYDAAYVAAAQNVGAKLLSCDVRDLVSHGLARLPP